MAITYQKLKLDGMIDEICRMHTGYSKAKQEITKKPKRDTYKEMSKAVTWCQADVDKLVKTYKEKIENVKQAGNYVRKASLDILKTKSREFIF